MRSELQIKVNSTAIARREREGDLFRERGFKACLNIAAQQRFHVEPFETL